MGSQLVALQLLSLLASLHANRLADADVGKCPKGRIPRQHQRSMRVWLAAGPSLNARAVVAA